MKMCRFCATVAVLCAATVIAVASYKCAYGQGGDAYVYANVQDADCLSTSDCTRCNITARTTGWVLWPFWPIKTCFATQCTGPTTPQFESCVKVGIALNKSCVMQNVFSPAPATCTDCTEWNCGNITSATCTACACAGEGGTAITGPEFRHCT